MLAGHLHPTVTLRGKGRAKGSGQLQVSKLNDFYKDLRERLEHSVLSKDQLKATRKAQAKAAKQEKKAPPSKPRVFVLDFDGDIKASATDNLRHEVTALYEIVPGFAVATLAIVVVSLLTKPPPQEIQDLVDYVRYPDVPGQERPHL